MQKKSTPGYSGSEAYFGNAANFSRTLDPIHGSLGGQQEIFNRPKFPVDCSLEESQQNASCSNFDNPIQRKGPRKTDFYSDWYYDNEVTAHNTIGAKEDEEFQRLPKRAYSIGNANEIKTNWGMDTLQYKEQMGGRYDGESRYPQEDTGNEDWRHERSPNNPAQIVDWANTWVEYNKGDGPNDSLLKRWWAENQGDWPGREVGHEDSLAEGPAFSAGEPSVKPHKVQQLKNAATDLRFIAQALRRK